jgi:hypothetical protein
MKDRKTQEKGEAKSSTGATSRRSRRRGDSAEKQAEGAAGNLALQQLLRKRGARADDAQGAKVSKPGDAHELEADRFADSVVSSSPAQKPDESPLTNASSGRTPRGPDAASSEGHPLPEAEREFFESRLGADLGGVRVHTSEGAAASADELRARAYTSGRDVFFGEGEYAPGTSGGQRLLAHELAHVVQQEADGTAGKTINRAPGDGNDPDTGADASDAATDGGQCTDEPTATDQGDGVILPPGTLLFSEVGGGLFVVRADTVARGDASPDTSMTVESDVACEVYDRISVETAFADAGAPVAGEVHSVSPSDGEIYFLIWAFLQAQEGGESAVVWDDVAKAVSRVVDPDTLFGPSMAMAAGPVGPGPWAPPGGQPIPFYIGNTAHIGIALEYLAAHAGDAVATNFTPITTLLDAFTRLGALNNPASLSPGELIARPDIINMTRRHLYEIKPYTGATQAAGEAAWYAAIFAKAGILVSLGPSGEPGTSGIIPAPGGYFSFASPAPGVIVYQYRRGTYVPVPVPVPVPVDEPVEEPRTERRWYKWRYWEEATGLTGVALLGYLIISEGSRLYPPRNLIPAP